MPCAPQTVLVHDSDEAMQKANKIFQEKQYEQHHHLVHVSRSKEDHPTYLDSLSKYSSVDPDAKAAHEKTYLDSLSDLKATKSTWADYKTKVDRVTQEKVDTVDGKQRIRSTNFITTPIHFLTHRILLLIFDRT